MTKKQLLIEIDSLTLECEGWEKVLEKRAAAHKAEMVAQQAVVSRLELVLQSDIEVIESLREEVKGLANECHHSFGRLERVQGEHDVLRKEIDQAFSSSSSVVEQEHGRQIVLLTEQLLEVQQESNRRLELARRIAELAVITPNRVLVSKECGA